MADAKIDSVFETAPDDAEEARLDRVAGAEIDAGHGVPHEKVRAWLLRLAKGEIVPPPTA